MVILSIRAVILKWRIEVFLTRAEVQRFKAAEIRIVFHGSLRTFLLLIVDLNSTDS